MAYEPTVYAPSLKRRNPLSDPYSPDDAESEMESDSPESSSPAARSVTSGAAGPRPLSPSPFEPYLSGMSDISEKLMSAYQAPRPGAFRQVLGAILSKRNPQLGGLVSGELQRQRTIEPLQQEYNLLASGMSSRLQMAKDLAEANAKNYIAPRGGGVVKLSDESYLPGAGPTPQRETTPDQQTFDYLTSTPDAKLGRPLTEPEAYERIASMKQDTKGQNQAPHTVVMGKRTYQWDGQKWNDIGPAKEPEGQTGSWQFAEDDNGQSVLFNPKTGETKPAPPGVHPKGSQGLTTTTKSMVEVAPKVQGLVNRMQQQIKDAEGNLGPMAGRWREFSAGKVGFDDPAFSALRTNAALLQTALMRMHVGARGGELIMQHFKDLFDVGKQSPENLKAALDEISNYASDVIAEGKQHGMNINSPSASSGGKYARPTAGVVVEQ